MIKKQISLLLLAFMVVSFKNTSDWYLLVTKSYKILFPKKPIAMTKDIDSKAGKLTMNVYMYNVSKDEKDHNHLYITNETLYPDALFNSEKKDFLDEFFNNSILGAVNNAHGKLMSKKIIQLDNYPGREVIIGLREGSAVAKLRMYLVKNTMFMIETITDANNQSNKSIDKFMESFQLN